MVLGIAGSRCSDEDKMAELITETDAAQAMAELALYNEMAEALADTVHEIVIHVAADAIGETAQEAFTPPTEAVGCPSPGSQARGA